MRAIFFGRVVQVSEHAAPADSPAAWFSHVRKSERFQQEVESHHCRDLAHIVISMIGDNLERIIKREEERQRRRQPFLEDLLSELAVLQLSISVGILLFGETPFHDPHAYP